MKQTATVLALCFVILAALTACSGGPAREPVITAIQGPADTALPYQAVFAVDENADERLISAAKNFCDRTVELSQGGTVFSFATSKDALQDLRSGKADVILLENASVPEFALISEAFRYKSYEHFSMTVNSQTTLSRLSDMLEANVFAGFYAGSNVFLSTGTLDSAFRPRRRDATDTSETRTVTVTTISDMSARAFDLLGAIVTKEPSLDARAAILSQTDSAVEFASAELDSSVLLQAVSAKSREGLSEPPSPDKTNAGDNSEYVESDTVEPETLVLTQAFTGVKPVWLVFAPSVYERLSQTGRMSVAEAAAYMTSDIDGVYREYEREKIDLLTDEYVTVSNDFAVTRTQSLRLSDEHPPALTSDQRKLRESISRVQ